jgi:hypothetical protein
LVLISSVCAADYLALLTAEKGEGSNERASPHRLLWSYLMKNATGRALHWLQSAALFTVLLDDVGHNSRADSTPAFANCEAQTLVHRDWLDQVDLHRDVVTRHDHLDPFGQMG